MPLKKACKTQDAHLQGCVSITVAAAGHVHPAAVSHFMESGFGSAARLCKPLSNQACAPAICGRFLLEKFLGTCGPRVEYLYDYAMNASGMQAQQARPLNPLSGCMLVSGSAGTGIPTKCIACSSAPVCRMQLGCASLLKTMLRFLGMFVCVVLNGRSVGKF